MVVEHSNNMNNNNNSSHERKNELGTLLATIEKIEESDDRGLQTVQDVGEILSKLCQLGTQDSENNRIDNPNEVLLDAKVMKSATKLVMKSVSAVEMSSSVYESAQFSEQIRRFVKSEDAEEFETPDILELLDDADDILRDVPEYCPLYGTYEIMKIPVPKVPEPKSQRQRQEKEKKTEPTRVVNSRKEEQSMDDTVEFLLEVLMMEYRRNGNEPIEYFKYVIDTRDFGQTVQNIFYTAFILRDGKAKLEKDEDGVPRLQPSSRQDLKAFRHDDGANTQLISSIDMDIWKLFTTPGYLQEHRIRAGIALD